MKLSLAWTRFRRALFWILPLLILGMLFAKVDRAALLRTMQQTDLWLACAGWAFFPVAMTLGALRWRCAARGYDAASLPPGFAIRHYFAGQAVGLFFPGSVGWDAYRVIVAGRKFGHLFRQTLAIAAEKLVALLACVGLATVLFPWVKLSVQSPLLLRVMALAHGTLAVLLACLCVAIVSTRWAFVRLGLAQVEASIAATIGATLARMLPNRPNPQDQPVTLIAPLLQARPVLEMTATSLAILATGALASQLFFLAVGYPISFLANLFLSPILFFILVLPISFGGVGVRELSYVALYGLFHVPAETALLVSFLSFAGMLLNIVLGALALLFRRDRSA